MQGTDDDSNSSSSQNGTSSRVYFKTQKERNEYLLKHKDEYVQVQTHYTGGGTSYGVEKRVLTESQAKKLGYSESTRTNLRRSGRIQAEKINVYGKTPEKSAEYVQGQLQQGKLAYADYEMQKPTRANQKVFTFMPKPMADIKKTTPRISYYTIEKQSAEKQSYQQAEKTQPPAGYKAVTFTNEEAMRYGLISRETSRTAGDKVTLYIKEGATKQDLISYASYLKEQHLDIKRDREKVGEKTIPFETWANIEKSEQTQAEIIATDPRLKVRYVLEKDFLGIGTLQRYAVTAMTGGNWEQEQKNMLVPYARELMSDKTPAEMQAWNFVGNVGFKVGVFQALSKSPGLQFGAKALASGVGGYQIGTGIKMAVQTQGQATPEQGRMIAENFASGFLLTVPAQIEAYSKGIAFLRKPTTSLQVAGSKTKSVSYQTEKGLTETRSVTTERVNIIQKQGFLQKLGLREPSTTGKLTGEIRTVSQSGQVVQAGQSEYVYAGTINGKPVVFAGKQPQVSIYQSDQNAIQGFTFSKSVGKYQFYKEPSGDIKAYQVGQFKGTKYAETPKSDYWTYSQREGGIQEIFQVDKKAGFLSSAKFSTTFKNIFGASKSVSVYEKAPTDSFEIFKAGGSLQTKPTTTGTAPRSEVLNQIGNVIQKNVQGFNPKTGFTANIEDSNFQNLLTGDLGAEQVSLATGTATKEKIKEIETPKTPKTGNSGYAINQWIQVGKEKVLVAQVVSGPTTKTKQKTKAKQKEATVQLTGLGSMQKEMTKMFQNLGKGQLQGQGQGLKQAQLSLQKTAQRTAQRTGLRSQQSFKLESRPIGSSFKSFFSSVSTGGRKSSPTTRGRRSSSIQRRSSSFGGILKKAFLSDELSVIKSQLLYGKATHPRLTSSNWAKAEKSFFLKVPTAELREGSKRKRRFGGFI